MSETTDAVAGHAPNLFARWIVDNFPRFQVSCECGWKTAAEDSEQAATASHAEHARQPIGSPTWNPMSEQFERPPSLAEFLLARIAEDEAAARGVYSLSVYWRTTTGGHEFGPNLAYFEEPDDAVHVARWSPDRVLAECEAKRAIVSEHARLALIYPRTGRGGEYLAAYGQVLAAIAEPYADHADFREEWRT